MAGECRIGRNESQEISIRDPSVSGCHAVIDIVDLPDAGGKRVALKDLRSTNGTYVLNPNTGGKTRLVPKKTTVLAPEGCQVQFGNVLCKVTMGTAPSAAGRTDRGQLEGESAVFDAETQYAETQYPEYLEGDTEEEEQPEQGQEQHQQEEEREEKEEEKKEEKKEEKESGGGEKEDARGKAVRDESSDRPAPVAEAAQLLADVGTAKGPSDAPEGGMSQDAGGQSDRAGETNEPTELAGDSAATEDSAGVDDSATDEPETQFIAPGMDESTDEEEGAGFAPRGTATEITAGFAVATPAASLPGMSGASGTAKLPESSGPPAEARGGEETADEAEVSSLFETYDEAAVVQLAGDRADGKKDMIEVSQDAGAGSHVVGATPMSPSTDAELTGRNLLGSPGGFSDVPTQRQSPARDVGGARAGVHEEKVPEPLPLTDDSAKQSLEMENCLDRRATGGKGDRDEDRNKRMVDGRGGPHGGAGTNDGDGGDEADDDRSSSSSEALIPGPGRTAKQDEDDDDCTVSSDALIPAAQDLTGFEDQLARPPSAVRAGEATPADGSRDQEAEVDNEVRDNHAVSDRTQGDEARGMGGVSAPLGDLASATAAAPAGESATETDATEIDTDDGGGLAEDHPTRPSGTHREAAAAVESPATMPQAIAGDKDGDEGQKGSGETNGEAVRRSPGDAPLRRTSTEDVMQAIAREQQRAGVAGVDVASSRASDLNLACTPGYGNDEDDEDTQAPVNTLVDDVDEVHEEPSVAESGIGGAEAQGVAPEEAVASHVDPFVDRPVDKNAPEAPQASTSGNGGEGVCGSPQVVKEASGPETCNGARNEDAEGRAGVGDREGIPETPRSSSSGNGGEGVSGSPEVLKEVSGPATCSGVRDGSAEGQTDVGGREGIPETPRTSGRGDGDEGVSGCPEVVKEVSSPETYSAVGNGGAEGQANVGDTEGISEAPQASTGGHGDEGASEIPAAVKEASGPETCSTVGNGGAEGQADVGDTEGIPEVPQANTGSHGDEVASDIPAAVKEASGPETCSTVGNGGAEGQADVVDRERVPRAPQANTRGHGDEGVSDIPAAVKEASGPEACGAVGNGGAEERRADVGDRKRVPEAPQASTGGHGDEGVSASPAVVKEVSGPETCGAVGNGGAEGRRADVGDREGEVKEHGEPPQESKEVKGNGASEDDGKEKNGIELDRNESTSSADTRQEGSGVSKRDEKADVEDERAEQEAEAISKEGASVMPNTPSRDATPAAAFVPRTSGRKRTKPKMFDEIEDTPRESSPRDTAKNKGKGKPKRQSPETPVKVVTEEAEGGGRQEPKRDGDAEETAKIAADADAAGKKQAEPSITGGVATSVPSEMSPDAAEGDAVAENSAGPRDGGGMTASAVKVSPTAAAQEKETETPRLGGPGKRRRNSEVSPSAATPSGTRSGTHAKRSRKELPGAQKATAGGDEKDARGKAVPRAGGRDHARKAAGQQRQRQVEERASAQAEDSPGVKRGGRGGSSRRRKTSDGEEKQAPEGASGGSDVGAAAIGDEERGRKRRRAQEEKVSDSQGSGSSGRRSTSGRGQVQAGGAKGTKQAGDSLSSSAQKRNKGKFNSVSTPPARGRGAARGKSGVDSGASPGSPTPPRTSRRVKGETPKQGRPTSPKAPAKPSGSKGPEPSKANDVRVCFTNIMPTRKERSCLKKLGITEVENVLNATHLVAGGKDVPLKRTPKLLAGIGRCDFVVDVDWLYESAKVGRVLEGLEYVLFDAEAEKKWGFKMRSTLARRSSGKGLLDGLSVHVDPALATLKGLRCPPLHEMKMVVESAGARWLPTLPKGGFADPTSVLVISHPDALAVSGAKGAKSRAAVAAGRGQRGYVPEMLFLSIMKQKLQWSDSLAVRGDAERVEPGRPTGAGSGGRERNQATPRTNPAKRRRT